MHPRASLCHPNLPMPASCRPVRMLLIRRLLRVLRESSGHGGIASRGNTTRTHAYPPRRIWEYNVQPTPACVPYLSPPKPASPGSYGRHTVIGDLMTLAVQP